MSVKVLIHFSPETLSNSYIFFRDNSANGIMVDPSNFDVQLFDVLEAQKVRIAAVLLTHADERCARAIRTMQSIYDFEIFAGTDTLENLTITNIKSVTHFDAAGFTIESHFLPGHYLDSIIYCIENHLFSGDILSAGTVTPADGAYGRALLIQCLKESILTMPSNTLVLPVYGPPSTIEIESNTNVDLKLSPEIST